MNKISYIVTFHRSVLCTGVVALILLFYVIDMLRDTKSAIKPVICINGPKLKKLTTVKFKHAKPKHDRDESNTDAPAPESPPGARTDPEGSSVTERAHERQRVGEGERPNVAQR